jgi:AcrR family transcriptional regulator
MEDIARQAEVSVGTIYLYYRSKEDLYVSLLFESMQRMSEAIEKIMASGLPPDRQLKRLSVRMACRRFTRLTNAFSKKLDNLKAAMALHFAWYNFVRIHRSLRVTPAMAAGVTDRVWGLEELVA